MIGWWLVGALQNVAIEPTLKPADQSARIIITLKLARYFEVCRGTPAKLVLAERIRPVLQCHAEKGRVVVRWRERGEKRRGKACFDMLRNAPNVRNAVVEETDNVHTRACGNTHINKAGKNRGNAPNYKHRIHRAVVEDRAAD